MSLRVGESVLTVVKPGPKSRKSKFRNVGVEPPTDPSYDVLTLIKCVLCGQTCQSQLHLVTHFMALHKAEVRLGWVRLGQNRTDIYY